MSPWPGRRASGYPIVRRSGPPDEAMWWSPEDQAIAESTLLYRRVFGKRWVEASMVNNEERLDPFPVHPATDRVLAARQERQLTALDEGRAWRGLRPRALAVLRVEVFASGDDTTHRDAWRDDAPACLDATWRDRWAERDHPGGWVEARRMPIDEVTEACKSAVARWGGGASAADMVDAIDWLRVEDHTDPSGNGAVSIYEYVTIWRERMLVTLTVRHGLDDDLTASVAAAVAHVVASLPLGAASHE